MVSKTIKTSGKHEDFESGAKRDAREGKGRYDLISCHALEALAKYRGWSTPSRAIKHVWDAVRALAQWGLSRDHNVLVQAFARLCESIAADMPEPDEHGVLYPLASRLEEGAKHYGDRNWQNGMPLTHLYDSTVRHLDQWLSGMTDENHMGAAMFGVAALLDHEARLRNGEEFASDVDDWPVPLPQEHAE